MSLNPNLPLVYHPNYSFSFDPKHRFVMSKFALLYQHVKTLGLAGSNIIEPPHGRVEELEIVHCENYIHDLWHNRLDEKAMRRIGLPWSQALMNRTFTAPLGTLQTARLALKNGLSCHLAGGTHHAHSDFGSGFCMVNDLAFTAQTLIQNREVTNVLIFDLDVHQGDGTAAMLAHQPYAFTCSIHCEKNFPFRKSPSDLDIGLANNMQDAEYIGIVDDTLQFLLHELNPDLVLYDAGVDIWQEDGLGKLDISWQGIEKRDHIVLKRCLANNTPVATVIGGGYDRDHQRLAQRHGIVIEQAASF
ncbi:histone deacetylase family protein [Pseudoalteromonas tetraodonis]|uniref:histone deacetylase family protein n=1 Tax=Pseudoalteromonas tetraodonis TaxID=43659 RepID=UPI000849CE00|nr:histone deacetylase [Pseudoalteromonas tetraodonis]ODS12938.1 histone deacetylase superfamily protein [Pseudoalteromonas tetraodonis]